MWLAIFGGMAELAAGLAATSDRKPPPVVRALFSEDRLAQIFQHLFQASCPASCRLAAAGLLGAAPRPLSAPFLDR